MNTDVSFLKGWDNIPVVIFSFRGAYYAINAEFVESIVLLPELSPIEEAPDYFIGVFNLRGRVLPVMDLDRRFGYSKKNYSLTDSVLVVEYGDEKIGLVVNEVDDLQKISVDLIENKTSIGALKSSSQSIIAGQIKMDERLIMLLDHSKLVQHSFDDEVGSEKTLVENKERLVLGNENDGEVGKVFRKRALDLIPSVERNKFEGLECHAVFTLSNEIFAIDIDLVKEFSEVTKVFPTPCCPDFILGDINLRGDILTLIDIRSFLNLPTMSKIEGNKVVVVQDGDLIVGIQVDEVLDVREINSLEIAHSPESSKNINKAFIKGVLPYNKDKMVLIDLSRLLSSDSMMVNEEV